VRFTVAIAVYIQTPGTILSLSWPFDADDSCESAHDDKQQPYGRLLVARSYERLYLLFIPWSRERGGCGYHWAIRNHRVVGLGSNHRGIGCDRDGKGQKYPPDSVDLGFALRVACLVQV